MCAMSVVGEVVYTLNEAHQSNQIRWRILKRESDSVAKAQTTFFKCKDYFNDVVAAYRGCFFSAYGFDNKSLDLTDDQLLVQVKYLYNKDNYISTISDVINKKLEEDGLPHLFYEDVEGEEDSLILFFDRKLFDNTYTISFLTYLLRIANAEKRYAIYESLTTNENSKKDRPFHHHYDKIINGSFQSPLKQPFWWWSSAEYNNEKTPQLTGTTIHNNGCYSWMVGVVNGL